MGRSAAYDESLLPLAAVLAEQSDSDKGFTLAPLRTSVYRGYPLVEVVGEADATRDQVAVQSYTVGQGSTFTLWPLASNSENGSVCPTTLQLSAPECRNCERLGVVSCIHTRAALGLLAAREYAYVPTLALFSEKAALARDTLPFRSNLFWDDSGELAQIEFQISSKLAYCTLLSDPRMLPSVANIRSGMRKIDASALYELESEKCTICFVPNCEQSTSLARLAGDHDLLSYLATRTPVFDQSRMRASYSFTSKAGIAFVLHMRFEKSVDVVDMYRARLSLTSGQLTLHIMSSYFQPYCSVCTGSVCLHRTLFSALNANGVSGRFARLQERVGSVLRASALLD